MPSFRFSLSLVCLLSVSALSTSVLPASAALTPPVVLKTFNSETELFDLQVEQGSVKVEKGALKLNLNASHGWPQLRTSYNRPQDWTGKTLALTVQNTGTAPVKVGLRIDDNPAADGWKHSWTGFAILAPSQKSQIFLPMGAVPMDFGMRGFPPKTDAPKTYRMTGSGEKSLEVSNIKAWQLFVEAPTTAVHLLIDEISLLPADETNLVGLVDGFGQSTHGDWPGKIHSEAELKAKGDAELRALQTPHQQNENLDIYGGWQNGPQLEATGYFRTAQRDGKWWLVDPAGHLFFSSGVDVVQNYNPTVITGRENMFQEIAAHGSTLGQFREATGTVLRGPVKSGLSYDFGKANLLRKYGPDWEEKWTSVALARLRNWGFNTVGNWSDDALKTAPTRLPYVATVGGIYGDHARLSDGEDYWGTMHDPFDPKFVASTAKAVAAVAEKVNDDPYCIGYFVDNELGFGNGRSQSTQVYFGLVYNTLNADQSQPARKALLVELQKKYGLINKLNAAWGASFTNWNDVNVRGIVGNSPTPAMKADMSQLLEFLSGKYFAVVAAELKKVAPHHLYLGSRFSGRPPVEVAKAAAQSCDVVSFNIYAPRIDAQEWGFLSGLNKPTIIGEFHFGATDRGVWVPGLVEAKNQVERAAMFKSYVESALQNPNIVGSHWFQWSDEPATGRPLDGESFGIGFVDIADTPYTELVAAAQEINRDLYLKRQK